MGKRLEKDRITDMIEVVMKVARGDYSVQIELSGNNDDLDSLAAGLNMMIDDIRTGIEEIEKAKAELQSKVHELERFNRLSVGRELKMIELKKRIKELEEKAENK